MKRVFALLALSFVFAAHLHAAPKVEATTAKDKDSKPTDTFTADVPKVYVFFKTSGTKKSDTLRSVWIADDVGEAAPANTKIDEASVTGDKDDFVGAFSLSKPTKGWPVGKYHVDIYSDDQVVTTVKFTIKAGKGDAASDEDDDDDDKSDD
ncbi:MAG: hypothetical protein M3128_12160 [Verrucomicrobiota bacterium]|nr:hypothetical protein [Verrucomicrobiota bacterium]